MPTDDSTGTGVYYDENGRAMQGSTQVHDPEFDARVVPVVEAVERALS